jgi:hypothetical protein
MMALPAECWVGTRWVSRGTARVLECAAAAARPRAARAVLSCAGAYISGAAGSNACPAGSVRIATEAACRTAVTAAGKTAGSPFVVPSSTVVPRGCFYCTGTDNAYAYFNAHAVGAGNPDYRLLCAAVTTGAHPPRLRFGRVRTPMRDCCNGMGSSGLHVG